jgi:protein gp37
MSKTGIPYADEAWNIMTGCTVVSPACENCYACRLTATRLKHHPDYQGLARVTEQGRYQWTGEVRIHADKLEEPLHWKKPRRVFVVPMGDLFHEAVPDWFILAAFKEMSRAPRHTFLLLTKRPERMLSIWPRAAKLELSPNVWAGVTVENQENLWRFDMLRRIPAGLRWVSFEPLLQDLGLVNLEGISWCIVGGESGPGARPMHPDWLRSLRDQCVAAGVAFYFKQVMMGRTLIHAPFLDEKQWLEVPHD